MEQHMDSPMNMSQLLRLAQSPAGQQLFSLLQQNGGTELQDALAKASMGDYAQAKQALSSLLSSPEAQELIRQLGGTP